MRGRIRISMTELTGHPCRLRWLPAQRAWLSQKSAKRAEPRLALGVHLAALRNPMPAPLACHWQRPPSVEIAYSNRARRSSRCRPDEETIRLGDPTDAGYARSGRGLLADTDQLGTIWRQELTVMGATVQPSLA